MQGPTVWAFPLSPGLQGLNLRVPSPCSGKRVGPHQKSSLGRVLHTVNLAYTTGAHLRDTEMGRKVDLGTSWRLLKQTTQVSAQETKYRVSGTRLTVTFRGVTGGSIDVYQCCS